MKRIVRRVAGTPLSKIAQAQLKHVAAMPDSEIDYSDIPALSEEQLKNLRPASLYRPMKHQITVRLDADILAWAKRDGRGYQTRINTILRKAMLKDLATAAPKSKSRKAS